MEKCPKCELNFMEDGQETCEVCKPKVKDMLHPVLNMSTFAVSNNYKELKRGGIYGTVAKNIYLECCKLFGWDVDKSGNFAKQQRLYSEMMIDGSLWGIWFWAHSNMTGTMQKDEKWVNVVDKDNPKLIYMHVDESVPFDARKAVNRIVFAKDQKGKYIFLGCFQKKSRDIENRKDTYELISDTYPIK